MAQKDELFCHYNYAVTTLEIAPTNIYLFSIRNMWNKKHNLSLRKMCVWCLTCQLPAASCRDKQWVDSKIKTHPLDNLCENSENSLCLLALSVFIFYLVKYLTQCCAMRSQKHKSLIFSRADLSRAGWFKITAFTPSSGKFRHCIDHMHLQILCHTCWLFSLQSIQQSIF